MSASRSLVHSASLAILALALALPCPAQGSKADYKRANNLGEQYRNKVHRFAPKIQWMEDGKGVWWATQQGEKVLYSRVTAATGKRVVSHDPMELGLAEVSHALKPRSSWSHLDAGGVATTVVFENTFDQAVRLYWVSTSGKFVQYGTIAAGEKLSMSTYANHAWVLDFKANDLAGIFIAEPWSRTARIDEESRKVAMRPKKRPQSKEPKLKIIDNNLHIRNKRGQYIALSKNGTAADPYLPNPHWSPDKSRVLAFQESVVELRQIPLVESSPKDQVQPKTTWIGYRKPGDKIPQRRPRLFNVARKKQLPIDDDLFQDSFRVNQVHWAPDSSKVFCLYNQRGHQQLAMRSINAKTGAVTTLVDERSNTFIDYSQKSQLRWLDSKAQLLWASERDGHNHLYRYDTRTGKLLNQVTRGSWVVRSIEAVDEAKEQIWFMAMGIHAEQDPYYQHLVRVDFDGSNLVVLTQSNATHVCTLSDDRSLFIDRWSRIDQASVTELRDASDGSLILELGRDEVHDLLQVGYVPPQPFVAKGRDGKTDIHGIIIRPSNFDPERKYPVIEAIYAGPHGFFVPKGWELHLRDRRMADLGFIVVRVDGMGTNWRSKAFHDVCWQNLKDSGFPDRIAWMRAAAQLHPEMDLTRVGIYGGSAGGQSALAALLHHGDFYDAAASDCGCHDNRMDKIWWNEAWMGKIGPHYASSSNVTHASKLTGKLLLTVGELDRNVDPASTLQVVNALIAADKEFDFVMMPGAGHGIGEGQYLFRKRQDFFVRSLYGLEPRH
ncbi:MAG: dipeptidyl-peptidase-4 [Planctomycetota bacterium]|jgi:dipeptidyl-peptidase-4